MKAPSHRILATVLAVGTALASGADVANAQTSTLTGKSVEIHADTMSRLAEVLAPYQVPQTTPPSPAVARALAALRKEQLVRPPQPRARDPLADRLGAALQLGARTRQFLPELVKVSDAIRFGDETALRRAIAAVWTKAGRSAPQGAALDQLASAARAAESTGPAQDQHVTIRKPDYTIQIDHSPSTGRTKVSVIEKDDAGQPERVTFSGDQVTTPRADGSGLDLVTRPDPPREATPADSEAVRQTLDGIWTDQHGFKWEVAGADKGDDAITFTETNAKGHRTLYKSQWNLGLVSGTHLIDDVEDMDDSLPSDVRATLATQWHPPFTIQLEFMPDTGALQGSWISGQVTYSGMAHVISLVEDPTWDKPLILTRPTPNFFLFARTATGRQNIKEFYLGVATEIEAQFDKAPDQSSFEVVVSVGEQKLTLTARKVDEDGHIFRTEAFVPTAGAAAAGEIWGDSPRSRDQQ